MKNQVQSCHLHHQSSSPSDSHRLDKNCSAASTWRNRPGMYEIHNILNFMSIIHLGYMNQINDQLPVGSLTQFV